MKKKLKILIILFVCIFIICNSIWIILNILNNIEFHNKYAVLIDSPDGNIELNEDICSIFEDNETFNYMVQKLEYNEEKIKNPRIYFINGILNYINDDKILKKIKGIDYNYPEIENGMINCYLSEKNFIKYFKDTYNILLTEKDLIENEDYMGAFYKENKKVLFSKIDEISNGEFYLTKVNSLSKLDNIYNMKISCYSFKSNEEMEKFKNNNDNNMNSIEKNVVFKLNKNNKYFNYTILSID